MSLIRISESDNWIVYYNTESRDYRVSYFEDGHFVSSYKFNEFKVEDYFLEYFLNKINQDILSGKGLPKL